MIVQLSAIKTFLAQPEFFLFIAWGIGHQCPEPHEADATHVSLMALAQPRFKPARLKEEMGSSTYKSRRSSSISADVPAPRSEGRQPSTTLSTNTDFHSLAE